MTKYVVKLVNHAGIEANRQGELQTKLQAIFNSAFDGSDDSVMVCWGHQADSDTIRVHHVESVAESVIVKTMTKPPTLKPGISGHTTQRGKLVGSEFYNTVRYKRNGKETEGVPSANKVAGTAFHECLHNVDPEASEATINALGGYGASPLKEEMTEALKTHITSKIKNKHKQLMVGKD